MKFFLGLTGLGLVLCLGSCGNSKKTTDKVVVDSKTSKKIACSERTKDMPQLQLDWIIEENSVLDNVPGLERPVSYLVYSLDSVQVLAFFRAAKDTSKKDEQKVEAILPLPAPLECTVFSFTDARVMSKGLQEKYTDIVALKGKDQRGQSDARLNYDGKWLKGQVIANGEVYLIKPVRNNGKTYYMVYRRTDSKEKKEDFEGTPGKTTK